MKRVKNLVAMLISLLFISACGPVPIAEACSRMDSNLTAAGYLFADRFYGDPNAQGGFVEATLWLFEQPDLQGPRLLIHLAPASGSVGYLEDLLQNVCADNPRCSLDGMSKFSISGHIFSTPMADCKLKVTDVLNIRFESK